ncbi:MAG TPA: SRPBCC family protein [Pseudolysinimonas sp.]|nr:SRPBCC family protein [Pseudolysinimonas sp.]
MTDALKVDLIPDGDQGTVRLEDRFDTDITDVWSAITDPERTARWIAVATGDFRVGGELQGRFTSSWEGTMRVEVCDAPHRLRLLAGTGDEQTVMEATLSEDGDGTRLIIEEHGLRLADAPYHAAGWHVHLQDLDTELAAGRCEPWEPRWRELFPAYGIVTA